MKRPSPLSRLPRLVHHAAFATGLAALGWVAAGAFGGPPFTLAITLAIAAFYCAGAAELWRCQRLHGALDRALLQLPPEPPPALAPWLDTLPEPLRGPVRQRIEQGGRGAALPGPSLAPFIAGLLVLLGMLGTFVGMVVTLHGTGQALQHATELEALRDALAAPVKGLGLAFGTSVAGVAASAMLGLMTALTRRERAALTRALDQRITSVLQPFSQARRAEHRHEETVRALQQQADAVPAMVQALVDTVVTPLVGRLEALTAGLAEQQQALQQRLLDDQQQFHARTEAAYGALATSVQRSLQESLASGARDAHAALQPVVEGTLAGLAQQAGALHHELAHTVRAQLDGLTAQLTASGAAQAAHWQQALEQHRAHQQAAAEHLHDALNRFTTTFDARAQALATDVASRLGTQHEAQQAHWATQDTARWTTWQRSVEAMAGTLRDAWQQAGDRTWAQQQQVCDTLARTAESITTTTREQARALLDEVGGLLQAAADAPRAAAEAIGELRQRLTDAMARDNAMLDERAQLLATLGTLLGAVQQASTEQRAAIEALVGTSTRLLHEAGERLHGQAAEHQATLAEAAAQVQGSAVELAGWGDAFGFAVQRFGASNEALMAQLQRIEAALSQSLTRSDEQLAYYVAQAREVIDLSLSSQQQIIEDLQQLARRQAA